MAQAASQLCNFSLINFNNNKNNAIHSLFCTTTTEAAAPRTTRRTWPAARQSQAAVGSRFYIAHCMIYSCASVCVCVLFTHTYHSLAPICASSRASLWNRAASCAWAEWPLGESTFATAGGAFNEWISYAAALIYILLYICYYKMYTLHFLGMLAYTLPNKGKNRVRISLSKLMRII